jgi:hypothetical protein
LYTKDKRVATERAPAVIAKFQAVIAEVRDKLRPQTSVPLAPLTPEIRTSVIARGGFGRRLVQATARMEQLRGSVMPIIIQPPPKVISMIQRARLEQQDDTPTITDDPVLFEKVVEAWANEKKQSAHTKNGYLNKTARFVKWLSQDRQKRGISALPENMRTITKAEFVRYKNDILTPGHEIAAGLGETSIIHYLVDLRTMSSTRAKITSSRTRLTA